MANNAEHQLQTIRNNEATSEDLERFDKLIGQAGDSAEKSCKRRRPEFYSVTLHQLRIKKSVLSCHYRNLQLKQDHQTVILQQRLQRAEITLTLTADIESTKTLLDSINQELKTATINSFELREKELIAKIHHTHPPGSESYVRRLRSLKKNEATRRAWQTMKFLKNGNSTQQNLTRLDIPESWPSPQDANTDQPLQDPKTCQIWKTVTQPDEIEYYIRMRNRGHFGQAHGTPFTELPLASEVNWTADTVTANDILLGHSQIDTIHSIPQCQALLDSCKAVSDLDTLPAEITCDEFKAKIQRWRELTTTSPSGRHLRRYKALLSKLDNPTDATDHDTTTYSQKQSFIINSIVAVINYCIRNNHTLQRWTRIINTMIFKETGNFRIHRLRVIHIYEADFNLLLAIKWRQLLQYANLQGSLNSGLFGGRPGCEAQSLVFLEELKYDISYCSRRTLFNFDNDATSCYDRIIIALASIINRKYGMHQRLVALHANTLQQAKFHLRTSTGISSESYSHCIQFPIYGSGQGSGNSPAIWLFISSTLCDIHNTISHGATFVNPQGTETVKLSMVAFVDDSTGTYNNFNPQTEPDLAEMIQHAQSNCQSWNDLPWCSGGKLELPKCSYHVLRFEFLPNGLPIPQKEIPTLQLTVKDAETGTMIHIPSKPADDPHKTLGHWKAPMHNRHNKQLQVLKDKASQLAILIGTGALSRHGAFLAYHAVYCASLKFVLPQCFFPSKVLDQAEAKSLPIILAKQGYNRNTAKPIRFCPRSYGGCGMIPWKVLQGEGQVSLFLKHWRTNTIISQMLKMALSWAQWNAGTSYPILLSPSTSLPHLESRWLSSLRHSLAAADMHIVLDNAYLVPPERHGDRHLMEWALASERYDSKQLKILNCCRLYLHVTTISKLFDAYGSQVQPHMLNCLRPQWFNRSQVMPLQPRPSHHQIRKLWKPLCQLLRREVSARRLQFTTWTRLNTTTRPYRASYADDATQPPTLYHWIQDAYWLLNPYHQHSQTSFITSHATNWQPTPTSVPINILSERTIINGTVFRVSQFIQPAPTIVAQLPLRPATFANFLTSLEFQPSWHHSLLQGTNFHVTYETFLQKASTSDHSWTILTDHHYFEGKTCFSWLLTQDDGTILISGSGPCHGPPDRTRADAWSILAPVLALQHVMHNQHIPTGQIPHTTITNRNKRIIRRIQEILQFDKIFCNLTLDRDWDIIQQTAHTAKTGQFSDRLTWTPLSTFFEDKRQQDILSYPTWTQRLYDTKDIAKTSITTLPAQQTHSPFLPASRCMLEHTQSSIHGRYNNAYREAATLPPLLLYMKKKHSWSDNTHKNIQWTWFTKSIHCHHESSIVAITKLVHNQLATQSRKSTTGGGQWVDPVCPHCQDTPETFQHLLRCKHPLAATCRTDILSMIHNVCVKRRAPIILQETLASWIGDWLNFETPDRTALDPRLHDLYDAHQHEIGWDIMLRGFFASAWSDITPRFNHHRPKPYDHQFLFPKIIADLWKLQLDFWRQYQSDRHQTLNQELDNTVSHLELQSQIRHLHSPSFPPRGGDLFIY